jgi:hypothetical protein
MTMFTAPGFFTGDGTPARGERVALSATPVARREV